MIIHKNARTTPNMRALIVGRRQAGETPRAIAGAATVRKWLRRHESRATVARIAKAKGLGRLSALDPRIEIVRYEKKQPGEMIHVGIKKLRRIEGVGHRITERATPPQAR